MFRMAVKRHATVLFHKLSVANPIPLQRASEFSRIIQNIVLSTHSFVKSLEVLPLPLESVTADSERCREVSRGSTETIYK
jgi:hypothetical protein